MLDYAQRPCYKSKLNDIQGINEMKELLNQPGFLPTHGTFGADISFLMAIAFTVLFIIGWRMAKKRQGDSHHVLVLWAMVSMIVYFTVYYLARGLGALATEGKEGFGGPEWVYQYVFSPFLTFNTLLEQQHPHDQKKPKEID